MNVSKTLKATALVLALGIGATGTARADYYPHHHKRAMNNLAAAVVVTGLIGAATAASRPVYVSPASPVYVTPSAPAPVYYTPAPGPATWYYCNSAGMYYPYTRHCPEGWRAVTPAPTW